MKRISILASAAALSLLTFTLGQSCSSDEGGDDDNSMNPLQGQGGASPGATGMGGAAAIANMGGSTTTPAEGQGGAPVTNNTGGTATSPSNSGSSGMGGTPAMGMGGSAMTGTGGSAPVDQGTPPACMTAESPSDGESCTVTCTDDCGVHALGTRVCTCLPTNMCDADATAPCMDCGECVFVGNPPLYIPPTGPLTPCTMTDDLLEDLPPPACTDNDRCQSVRAGDGANRFCGCLGGEWDCDSKPDNFTQ